MLSGEKVVGILSDRDVKKATPSVLSGVNRDRFYNVIETTPVSKVMSKPPVTISPQVLISEAVKTMGSKRVGCLPVVEDDRLVEIITQADIMDLFLEELDGRSPA